jgi:hypothetical protein
VARSLASASTFFEPLVSGAGNRQIARQGHMRACADGGLDLIVMCVGFLLGLEATLVPVAGAVEVVGDPPRLGIIGGVVARLVTSTAQLPRELRHPSTRRTLEPHDSLVQVRSRLQRNRARQRGLARPL